MGNDHSPYQVRLGDVISADEPMQFGKESALIEMPISWSLDDFPHFEFQRNARPDGGLRRAGELARRFRIHDPQRGVGHPHLHLPPLRDRPRPSHDDAGAADLRADRARRGVYDDGSGGAGISGQARLEHKYVKAGYQTGHHKGGNHGTFHVETFSPAPVRWRQRPQAARRWRNPLRSGRTSAIRSLRSKFSTRAS